MTTATKPARKPKASPAPSAAKDTAKPSRKPAKAKTAPALAAAPELEAAYQPGDFVVAEVNGQPVTSGIVAAHATDPVQVDVVNRHGRQTIPVSAIRCHDDYPPAMPLGAGDHVLLRAFPGQTFVVLQDTPLDGPVQLRDLGTQEPVHGQLARDVRVRRRMAIQDLFADLGMKAPDQRPPTAAAPIRVGDVVSCPSEDAPGETVTGGVIRITADEALVFLPVGSVKVHPSRLTPALLAPDSMAKPGDVLALNTREGLWEVTADHTQDGWLDVRHPLTGEEVACPPTAGYRVAHRASLADLCRDLQRPSTDLPAGEPAGPHEAQGQEDLPFPVTEAELDAALGAEPDYEALFPVGSRVTVDDGTTGTVHSHYHDPLVEAEEGVRADGCLVAPEGWDGTPEALHDVAHIQLSATPELPGTPVLISPADLKPGTLGLFAVPLHQTARSTCNVRHHYDPAAIEELAASLKAEGQIENATGRWNADGRVEIVAGESRRRAQLWREEQGEQGLTLLVNVRELTDAEALSISATENMRRRNMTALEECEAMHRLNEAGRSVEDIATMFGYKSLQPVADRILAAKTLHTTARDLLDRGELSLAQAVVIARAPGEDLQLSMTTAATRPHNPASAADLSRQLTRGQFLTKTAKFDVEKSGLEVVRDIFGMFQPYFRDKGKALNAQIEWANARAKLAQAKGKHPFVAVESGSGSAYNALASSRKYTYSYAPQKGVTGLIFYVNTDDGEVSEELSYSLKASAKDAAVKAGQAKADAPSRPMPDSAFLEAHEIRAAALRESVVGNTHVTLALTVWGLIISDSVGMVKLGEIHGLPKEFQGMPALADAVARLRERLRPGLSAKGHSYQQHVLLAGDSVAARQPLLELLLSFSDQELLEHLNTLTAITAYEWPQYNNQAPLNTEYAYLASLTGAPERLAQTFKLTDEWLKRYPRHELVALAVEAGLGRALVEDCSTLKEMRGRILEHADALHRDGFVPRLVQFPAPPTPKGTPAPEPERARALAALAALPDEALPALLDDSGYDHTDWDSEAEMREWALGQINTIGEDACAAWTELHAAAAELAAGAVA